MRETINSTPTSVRRDAWVEIDLAALEKNVETVLSWLSPATKLMAVVKSDAYGHGAAAVAPVLAAAGASWFGVASVDEGIQLRDAGIKQPVLVLSPCPFWALPSAIKAGLDLTVAAAQQVRDLAQAAIKLGQSARLHVKVDSGMHRLGASPALLPELLDAVEANRSVILVGWFSHLARADHKETTSRQNQRFKESLKLLPARQLSPQFLHLASGEAARRYGETHYDLVRVGLYLWGLEPEAVSQVVRPAMSVRARINHIQLVETGEPVGYELTWRATRPSRLASIPIGYADGVDRRLSNLMEALCLGKRIRQVGLISMDQMIFDITDVPEAEEGDIVTLIGSEIVRQTGQTSHPAPVTLNYDQLHLATWANLTGTITYELACRMRARLPRIYTRGRHNHKDSRDQAI